VNPSLVFVLVVILFLLVFGLVFAWAIARSRASASIYRDRDGALEGAHLNAFSAEGNQSELASPNEPWRTRKEAGRYSARLLVEGIFIYVVLGRALIVMPQVADSAIPEMFIGGVVGLLLSWRFPIPFNPTGSVRTSHPFRSNLPPSTVRSDRRRGRELLLRLRNPLVFVLAHVPYFAILLAVHLAGLSALSVGPTEVGLEWRVIFGGLGLVGLFATGCGVQMLNVWWSLRHEQPKPT
jgi:hypothetical protein